MRTKVQKALSLSLAAFALLLTAAAFARAQDAPFRVDKVEPPSWWAGHTINPVRLLIRGNNLRGAQVSPPPGGKFRASGERSNETGTYLFVDIHIDPATRPGDYTFRVSGGMSADANHTTFNFRVNAPLDPATHFKGITNDDCIYLIMPDRFADGDPSNDAPKDSPPEANDRANARAWHGGDLRGVIDRLPYLKELGVTAVWMTPWYDNWNGVNRCDKPWCPNTYYHGYHAVDYYAVEDRFGTMETLRELVEKAHALGLKVIQDQVANHVGSQHPWVKDPPLPDWFHGTLDKHVHNPFRGDMLLSPHAPEAERRKTLDGWFSDDLPDMNQEQPEVARYEIQNSLWWVGVTGIDGIRQDTAQYMPRPFLRDLNAALDRQYPSMWMVGEVWSEDPVHTSYFVGGRKGWDGVDTNLDAVFDFPAWDVSRGVFTGKRPASDLRNVLRSDSLYPDASRLVTMANNHDTPRFMSLPGATLEGAMLHLAYTLTIRGTPQVYAGEEIALEGGDDPDNRRDFPGGFPNDARDAFTRGARTPTEQRMYEWTRDLLRLRREHTALRRGAMLDLHFDEDAYAYARRDASETVVVALNRSAAPKELSVPAAYLGLRDGARLSPLLGVKDSPAVTAGVLKLNVPAKSAVFYKLNQAEARP
ncbi:MAG: cyclomaltodextrinase N-terminal domain-containing protein [Acidobacteria bacterium]|nr:cyclomaltodextrinase N-terminal domain-containing protein [Acidobacteriota bacterium]